MADDKDLIEEKINREGVPAPAEQNQERVVETQALDQKESAQQDNVKLRQEIEAMDIDDGLKSQVQSDTDSVTMLEEEKKLKHLLALAQKKGVVYAVKIAKEMNNPYVLDKFHDLLVEKGYYKDFIP